MGPKESHPLKSCFPQDRKRFSAARKPSKFAAVEVKQLRSQQGRAVQVSSVFKILVVIVNLKIDLNYECNTLESEKMCPTYKSATMAFYTLSSYLDTI